MQRLPFKDVPINLMRPDVEFALGAYSDRSVSIRLSLLLLHEEFHTLCFDRCHHFVRAGAGLKWPLLV